MGVLWPGICFFAVVLVAVVCLIIFGVWLVRKVIARRGSNIIE